MSPDTTDDGIPLDRAIEMYLSSRQDVSESTRRAHEYRLSHLTRWAADRDDIETTMDLTGRTLHEYREWRRRDGDLNTVSVHTQMATVRVFVTWLTSIDAVHGDVPDKIQLPRLDGADRRERHLDRERAEAILDYLGRYEYGSFDHALIRLLWQTAMRVGTAHALDVSDLDRSDNQLLVRHRPERGTPLKNRTGGERNIALDDRTVTVLGDYIDDRRPDIDADCDSDPLFATTHGRAHTNTLRARVYKWTQPCQIGRECPHGTTPSECPIAGQTDTTDGCPSIRSPHDVRTGSISMWLNTDAPRKAIEDRCNVSDDVLDAHYDVRAETEKAERRREFFE